MKLLQKLTLPILAIIVLSALGFQQLSQQLITQSVFQERATELQERALAVQAQRFQGVNLDSASVSSQLKQTFASYAGDFRDPAIFRVKIWDRELRITYSDYASLEGTSDLSDAPVINAIFNQNSKQAFWTVVSNPPAKSSEAGYGAYLTVRLPINDNQGDPRYVVEIFSSTAELVKQLQMYTRLTIVLLIAVNLLLLGGIYLILRGFVLRPVARLRSAMDVVGQGNLGHDLKSDRKDEIGQLTRRFDAMRQALQKFTSELQLSRDQLGVAKANVEQQVVERTGELRNEQARLAASIDSLPIGFVLVSGSYQVLRVNKTLESILNGSARDLTLDIIDQRLMGFSLHSQIAEAIKLGRSREFPDIHFGQRLLRIFISPISGSNAHNTAIGAVVLVEDVTEERTLQRAKDEFLSIASHELRTPLTVIEGDATILKQIYVPKHDDKNIVHMADKILESTTYLTGIVNEFLDMSHLELGKMSFDLQPQDITQLLQETVTELQPLADKQGLTITLELPAAAVPKVTMDHDRIKQVTVNLVGNALKYTERGGVTVRLEVAAGQLKVSVHDTGRGIPEDSQHLLFGKFQQTSSNILVRDFTRSTGLGLYISRLIMEGMGGRIFLESSAAGQGSVFAFTLPLAPGE